MSTRQTQSLPPPSAFGFSASKFPTWREDQIIALDIILNAPTRFVGLNMPTGSGKTLAYMAALILQGDHRRGVVLTHAKGLQDQLYQDFGGMGVLDIRGQRNYPCAALGEGGEFQHLADPTPGIVPTCDQGPCHAGLICSHKEGGGCGYYDNIRLGQFWRWISTNYAAWLAQKRYVAGFGTPPDMLILDEADIADEVLADSLTITIPKWELHTVGIQTVPDGPSALLWRDWAKFHKARLGKKLEALGTPQSNSDLKTRRRLKHLERLLTSLAEIDYTAWVPCHDEHHWKFATIRPSVFAEPHLFQGAKKVVLVSGTLTPKTFALLGIQPAQVTFFQCPSRFNPRRRPVIHVPTCNVDNKMKAEHWDLWSTRINQIVGARPGVKGIIHTRSYKRRDVILARADQAHASRMFSHGDKDLAKRVEIFKGTPSPLVLVSPSIVTGWNFPHDQCRFQIIAKLPFPDTRDPVIKARVEMDPEYLYHLTMRDLVQSVGRGMRDPLDWCETLVIDNHFKWFMAKYRHLAPQWFVQAVVYAQTIPKPLGSLLTTL